MIDFEPGHWSRVRQITLTKCARKLAEQQEQISKVTSTSMGIERLLTDTRMNI